MRALSNLIESAQPSVIAMQSGVLVLFVISFVIVLVGLSGKKKKQQCQNISRRALED
jgi:hypothetical protein